MESSNDFTIYSFICLSEGNKKDILYFNLSYLKNNVILIECDL